MDRAFPIQGAACGNRRALVDNGLYHSTLSDIVIAARASALACILGLMLTASGCGPDLLLGAGDLAIFPNPAQPGDSVTFVFRLRVIPEQDYTIIAFIDSTAHVTVDGFEAVDGPVVVQVGTRRTT